MRECLSNYTLFLLSEGEALPAARSHLAACAACTARHRQLARAGAIAGRVLSEGSWPEAAPGRASLARFWLAPVGVAIAATLALAWFGLLARGSHVETTSGAGAAYAALSLTDVASSIFAVDDGVWRAEQDPGAAALRAALQGEWPCDGADRLWGTACN
ncbi:MAG: hypothetical protein U0807_11475 [Candidatus Binatia bacterium]